MYDNMPMRTPFTLIKKHHPLQTLILPHLLRNIADNSRRAFFEKAVATATAFAGAKAAQAYSVPDLNYPFEALEPYIDAPTMKIHHDKHHGTYVANINKATEGKDPVPILDLMENALDATPVRNSGGGVRCIVLLFACLSYVFDCSFVYLLACVLFSTLESIPSRTFNAQNSITITPFFGTKWPLPLKPKNPNLRPSSKSSSTRALVAWRK